MLLSFRVSNFRSIKEEQEFSFLSSSPEPIQVSAEGSKPWDPSVGTVAGIFGANASGKSNVLKALSFMAQAVTSSYQSWASRGSVPVVPFALDPQCGDEPSLFEVVFTINKVRYQYGFRLTSKQIVGEWLYVYSTHRRQVWFERDISSDDVWYFGKSFTGRNRVIADLTNPTSLFLSAAVANNHKMVAPVDHWIRAHLKSVWPGDISSRTSYTQEQSSRKDRWNEILELVKFADLGITGARVRREVLAGEDRERLARILRAVGEDFADEKVLEESINRAAEKVEFGHAAGAGAGPVYLPFDAESLGTQVWFALAGPILRAIHNGDTLTIDEIDSSLHPKLTTEILKIFRDPDRNPRQAQLIFTTHDTTLMGNWLDEQRLTRDQVWFTEKKPNGVTTLYPLTDFSPRKTENLEKGYLQGRYGAIPYLDDSIIDVLTDRLIDASNHEEREAEKDFPEGEGRS